MKRLLGPCYPTLRQYEVRAREAVTRIYYIEAESEEHARRIWSNGGGGHGVVVERPDCGIIESVKEIK